MKPIVIKVTFDKWNCSKVKMSLDSKWCHSKPLFTRWLRSTHIHLYLCVLLHGCISPTLNSGDAKGKVSPTFKPRHSHVIFSAQSLGECFNLSYADEYKDTTFSWGEWKGWENTGKCFAAGYFGACWEGLDNTRGSAAEIGPGCYQAIYNSEMSRLCNSAKGREFL